VNLETWTAVDRYLNDLFVPPDPALDAALEASAAAGLPSINVTPNQGKLLQLFARMNQARNILEIGTLGGYSTIWLARALPPGGRLVTLESEPKHAEIARTNLARAGVAGMIFIDADKQSYADYFTWALKLSRRGTLIIADNVVRKGAVTDADSGDPLVQGVRHFHELLAAEKRVSATVIQTVGSKGHDGFAIGLVMEPGA